MGSRTAGVRAAVCAVLFVITLCVGSAIGAGGRTIATAPTIQFGQQQLNTLNGIDYWRIPLKEGDRLTVDYGPQQSFNWVEICLQTPNVTDATVGNQPCYARQANVQESKLTMDARPGGLWTLAVMPYPGCDSGGIINPNCGSSVSYTLTVYVKHQTHMTLRGPSITHRGSHITISGRLTGTRGSVLVEQSWNGGGWATVGIAHPSVSGSFSIRLTPKKKGSLRVRATFPEAPTFIGSGAAVFVRVI
jgi:hypothetical protein